MVRLTGDDDELTLVAARLERLQQAGRGVDVPIKGLHMPLASIGGGGEQELAPVTLQTTTTCAGQMEEEEEEGKQGSCPAHAAFCAARMSRLHARYDIYCKVADQF